MNFINWWFIELFVYFIAACILINGKKFCKIGEFKSLGVLFIIFLARENVSVHNIYVFYIKTGNIPVLVGYFLLCDSILL